MDDVAVLKLFDTLNLSDFIKVAMLGPRFRQLIEDHNITGKYSLHSHKISIYVNSALKLHLVNDSSQLIIDQQDEILFAIQQYGHIFKSLQIDIHLNEGYHHLDEVQSLVNKYCSKATQKITIYSLSANYLSKSNVNISFPSAKEVNLIYDPLGYIHNSSIALDKAFPDLEQLYVNRLDDVNYNFPHLKHVYLNPPHLNVDAIHLINFMRLNPQLETMLTPVPNYPTFFSTLNELLPHLENLFCTLLQDSALQIDTFHSVRFKQLKRFSIDAAFAGDWFISSRTLREVLDSFNFDGIEGIAVGTDSAGLLDIMIEKLLVKNTAVKDILINANVTFNQLSSLIPRLPELKKLTVNWRDPSTLDVIKKILEFIVTSDHGLEIVCVELPRRDQMTNEDLLEFVPVGWTYDETEAKQNTQLLRLKRLI